MFAFLCDFSGALAIKFDVPCACALAQVCNMLRTEKVQEGPHAQVILGRPVCRQAFCRLLGIGHGRFQKLKASSSKGVPLVDGRFVRKVASSKVHCNRVLVHEFLEELYQTLSEPMPEASEATTVKNLGFRRRKGKRPRIASRQSKMSKGDKKKHQMRFLPPGSFTDYLHMLQARHPDHRISLKLFSSEPCLGITYCFPLA